MVECLHLAAAVMDSLDITQIMTSTTHERYCMSLLDLLLIDNIQFTLEIVFIIILITMCMFLFTFIQVFELMGKVVTQIACGRYHVWHIAFN